MCQRMAQGGKERTMTREEAIQILSTRDWSGMLCGYTGGYTEALDMAIEALSKPIVDITQRDLCKDISCEDWEDRDGEN